MPEPPRQQKLLHPSGVLRHDARHLADLTMVLGHARIESHRFLGERQRRFAVAECVSNLRQQKLR